MVPPPTVPPTNFRLAIQGAYHPGSHRRGAAAAHAGAAIPVDPHPPPMDRSL